jgi:hypothetical protein
MLSNGSVRNDRKFMGKIDDEIFDRNSLKTKFFLGFIGCEFKCGSSAIQSSKSRVKAIPTYFPTNTLLRILSDEYSPTNTSRRILSYAYL